MRCVVTGGAGFIGSNLVDRLIDDGCEVIVFDDLSTGKEENIKDAQRALSHRALMNRKAAQGLWDLSLESN